MKKHISILGCGWLGFALEKALLRKGYRVNGSTTKPGKLSMLRVPGSYHFLSV